ncbi:MAG: hypothetical protein ABIB47_04610 [Candidatus Woesearchaeota archaeon]
MVQRDTIVPNVKIKDKSIFSLEELYKLLFRWFELNQYDFNEQEYRDEDTGAGQKHLEIKWYAEKKINDYFKFVIETNFLVLGLEKVEIESGGVKRNTNKGEVELRIKAYILKDYENRWEAGFMRFLRAFYEKFVIRGRIDDLENQIYEEAYRYMDEIKAFLNLHRF